MPKVFKFSMLSSLLVPILIFPVNAQMIDFTPAVVMKSVHQSNLRKWYGNDMCYGLLSSAWKAYQRYHDRTGYPTAENIYDQRKYETKYGCPHIFEADGTVNRVRGINDSSGSWNGNHSRNSSSNSQSSSQSSQSSSQVFRNVAKSFQHLPEPVRQEAISMLCSDDSIYQRSKIDNRPMTYEELFLLRRELGC